MRIKRYILPLIITIFYALLIGRLIYYSVNTHIHSENFVDTYDFGNAGDDVTCVATRDVTDKHTVVKCTLEHTHSNKIKQEEHHSFFTHKYL